MSGIRWFGITDKCDARLVIIMNFIVICLYSAIILACIICVLYIYIYALYIYIHICIYMYNM